MQTTNTSELIASPEQVLTDSIEALAAAILTADVEDLGGLAGVHTCLQQISQSAAELATLPQGAELRETATTAEKIVECIILRDATDPAASLRTLCEMSTRIQSLHRGKAAALAPAPTPARAVPVAPPQATATESAAHPELNDAEQPVNVDDIPLAQEFISEANSHIEAVEANLLKLDEEPGQPEALAAIFRGFHTVKGGAGFLNLKQIGALAHAAENLLDLARKGKLQLVGPSIDVVLESLDLLKELVAALDLAIRENKSIPSTPKLPPLLTRLHQAASGTLTQSEAAPAESPKAEAKSAEAKADASHGDGTVKVSTERLDSLINMVGELVISQAMVSQDVSCIATNNHRVIRNLSHLGKITRELQDLSMSMRMVPIQGVFQKMARVVRDISRKSGKEVEFSVVGGETELDRNIVEAISDPLVHMVRNSVDHGIEPAEQRLAAGKSRAGKLELRARHQAGQIIIEIVDDGRGLNGQKILKKAIESGIVHEGDQLTDSQIYQLIFAAGLSTADKITDISGRGVGMDVVRKNVEALRGRIEINTVPGSGTTFSIHLPLTLAIIDGMVVRVGSERYIIPINSIEQSLRPKAEQLSTVQRSGEMCMIRGNLMPLTRLHRLFNVKPRQEDPTASLVVIVHDNLRRCCLLVDELLGQQQVVIKSLGENIGTIQGVSGAAILGDGNISMILDVPGLMDLAVAA